MAEINLKALIDEHDKAKSRITAVEADVEKHDDVIEEYGKFIVQADRNFNELGNALNGDGGIYARLRAVEARKAAGQPDWMRNRDPETAAQWIEAVSEYELMVLREVMDEEQLRLAPCWPWHPRAVGLLLASMAQYDAAMRGGVPREVTEHWRIYFDFTVKKVNLTQGKCRQSGADVVHAQSLLHPSDPGRIHEKWHVDLSALPDYLAWWCSRPHEGIPAGLSPS